MQALADRLREGEQDGAALFTREDVDRIVSERVARELKKRRRLEGELEELRQGREDAVLRTARAGLRGCSIAAWERTVQADQGRPANRPAMRPGAG